MRVVYLLALLAVCIMGQTECSNIDLNVGKQCSLEGSSGCYKSFGTGANGNDQCLYSYGVCHMRSYANQCQNVVDTGCNCKLAGCEWNGTNCVDPTSFIVLQYSYRCYDDGTGQRYIEPAGNFNGFQSPAEVVAAIVQTPVLCPSGVFSFALGPDGKGMDKDFWPAICCAGRVPITDYTNQSSYYVLYSLSSLGGLYTLRSCSSFTADTGLSCESSQTINSSASCGGVAACFPNDISSCCVTNTPNPTLSPTVFTPYPTRSTGSPLVLVATFNTTRELTGADLDAVGNDIFNVSGQFLPPAPIAFVYEASFDAEVAPASAGLSEEQELEDYRRAMQQVLNLNDSETLIVAFAATSSRRFLANRIIKCTVKSTEHSSSFNVYESAGGSLFVYDVNQVLSVLTVYQKYRLKMQGSIQFQVESGTEEYWIQVSQDLSAIGDYSAGVTKEPYSPTTTTSAAPAAAGGSGGADLALVLGVVLALCACCFLAVLGGLYCAWRESERRLLGTATKQSADLMQISEKMTQIETTTKQLEKTTDGLQQNVETLVAAPADSIDNKEGEVLREGRLGGEVTPRQGAEAGSFLAPEGRGSFRPEQRGSLPFAPGEIGREPFQAGWFGKMKFIEYEASMMTLKTYDEEDYSEHEMQILEEMGPHEGIISLLEKTDEGLVFKFEPSTGLGALTNFLHLEPNDKLHIITQLCNSIQHVHDNEIIHRNIQAGNILLNRNLSICLTGFELACNISRVNAISKPQPNWMAYEEIDADEKSYTTKSDIWSLGMTVWEIMEGEIPWKQYNSEEIIRLLHAQRRPDLSEWPTPLQIITKKCWFMSQSQRPTARELRNEFSELQQVKIVVEAENDGAETQKRRLVLRKDTEMEVSEEKRKPNEGRLYHQTRPSTLLSMQSMQSGFSSVGFE